MEKKYILERPRLRGMVLSAFFFYEDHVKNNPDKPITVRDMDSIIDEYATEYDEVE